MSRNADSLRGPLLRSKQKNALPESVSYSWRFEETILRTFKDRRINMSRRKSTFPRTASVPWSQ